MKFTADARPHQVAQTGSLLYRGLAIRTSRYFKRTAGCQSATQQVANLRYTTTC